MGGGANEVDAFIEDFLNNIVIDQERLANSNKAHFWCLVSFMCISAIIVFVVCAIHMYDFAARPNSARIAETIWHIKLATFVLIQVLSLIMIPLVWEETGPRLEGHGPAWICFGVGQCWEGIPGVESRLWRGIWNSSKHHLWLALTRLMSTPAENPDDPEYLWVQVCCALFVVLIRGL